MDYQKVNVVLLHGFYRSGDTFLLFVTETRTRRRHSSKTDSEV